MLQATKDLNYVDSLRTVVAQKAFAQNAKVKFVKSCMKDKSIGLCLAYYYIDMTMTFNEDCGRPTYEQVKWTGHSQKGDNFK